MVGAVRRQGLRDHMARGAAMIESIDLKWCKAARSFTLHLRQSSKPLLHVVPDDRYSDMWRIRHDGRLSDMANLARAKDAALSVALGVLNCQKDYRESLAEVPPVRSRGCPL